MATAAPLRPHDLLPQISTQAYLRPLRTRIAGGSVGTRPNGYASYRRRPTRRPSIGGTSRDERRSGTDRSYQDKH